ncbi:MAG: BACON domain-containing protein [Bacteroidaceae bacterium]|nr:BACON domain-containing protein [Bacteroidaceae bacterium]
MYSCIFLFIICLTGCGDVEPIGDGHYSAELFKLSQYSLDFTATDLKKSIDINANCTWTISKPSGADWLAINPSKGDGPMTVTFEPTDTTNISARTADLTVTTATGLTNIIHVRQAPGKTTLTVTASITALSPLGDDCAFSVTSNHAWTGSITAGDFGLFSNQSRIWKQEGFNEQETTTDVSIRCAPNTTLSERTLTLTFITDNSALTETRTVTQLPGTLPVFTSDLTIDDLTRSSAVATFSVRHDTFPITECGILLRSNPAQERPDTIKANSQTVSQFSILNSQLVTVPLTGLVSGQTYYAQAYARNAVGIVTLPSSVTEAVEFTVLAVPGKDDNPVLEAKRAQ